MITFYAASDKGNKREINEDSYWPTSTSHPHPNSPYGQLFIVADGMGGHGAGDVASQLAIEQIVKHFYSTEADDEKIKDRLERAIGRAHAAIRQKSTEDEAFARMGTTLVAAVVQMNEDEQSARAWVAWAGDSRVYALRENRSKWRQVTEDHTKLWPQIDAGTLSWEALRFHPDRSKINRSLAAKRSNVTPDIKKIALKPGDQLLLCSDGVTSEVRPHEIEEAVTHYAPQQAVNQLIALAKKPKQVSYGAQTTTFPGGDDNITALVLELSGGAARAPLPPSVEKPTTSSGSNNLIIGGIVAFVAVLLCGLAGGFFLLSSANNESTATSQAVQPTQTSSDLTVVTPPTPTVAVDYELDEPTATTVPTEEPTATLAPDETRLPTATRGVSGSPTVPPTATPFPILATAIPTASRAGEFTLLGPTLDDPVSNGDTTFEWQWSGELAENQGFEVRLWRDNEPRQGVHDAVKSNSPACNSTTESCIERVDDITYRLTTNIANSPSVNERGGNYYWAVYLVEIDPEYKNLDILSDQVSSLKYADPTSSGSSGGGGGGGGLSR